MNRTTPSLARIWVLGLVAMLAVGCGDDPKSEMDATADMTLDTSMDAEMTMDTAQDMRPDVEDLCNGEYMITLTTDDGVMLEADLSTGGVGTPVVVLLHMIPPSNDRSNWPDEISQRLVTEGIAVLNMDRRGAANRDGVPEEAYEGPNGVLDAKAAYDYLAYHPCLFEVDKFVFVGASNGTTTVLDFAVLAGSDADIQMPAGLGMLSPNAYTENQHTFAEQRTLLDPLSVLMMYPSEERDWPAQFEADAPANWVLAEFDPGGHGTLLFAASPDALSFFVDWVRDVVR